MDDMIRDLPAHRHGPNEEPGAAPDRAGGPKHAVPPLHTVPLTQAVSARPAPPPGGAPPDDPRATGPDGSPVFVDATGRRHRMARRIGLLAGALLIVFLGALGSLVLRRFGAPVARAVDLISGTIMLIVATVFAVETFRLLT